MYFAVAMKEAGGLGKLHHIREAFPVDHQTVVRGNRDTFYSSGVFDLEAGPVTITMPDAGKRFMSLMVVNQDHYVTDVAYGGEHTFSRERIGTRYVMLAVRTLVDPTNATDVQEAHALQDAIKVEQKQVGTFEVPKWDMASQKKVRDALLVLAAGLPDMKGAFGTKEQVDPVRHLIGTAAAWGGNPDKDAIYLNITPSMNDGTTPYRLTVGNVPVDAFWSISVYDAEGYFTPNPLNAYSVNSTTAKKAPDGTITVQFGGQDDGKANYLPIMKGWNYMVRLYRPRAEIIEGTWKFPEATPVR